MNNSFEAKFILGISVMMICFVLSLLAMIMFNSVVLTLLMWLGVVFGVLTMINALVFGDVEC